MRAPGRVTGVPSPGHERRGAHAASVPPGPPRGSGAGGWDMWSPLRGGGGRWLGRALRAQGPRPRPHRPPQPARPGAGPPVAMAAPPPWAALPWRWLPSLGARYCSSRPPPPPAVGSGRGRRGGPTATCGRGTGLGARGCSRPKQPTAPLPLRLMQPLRGGSVGPRSLRGMDSVQGARGWAQGGAGCGGCSARGLWWQGGVLTDPWGLGSGSHCGCWRPAPWGPRHWAGGWVPAG